jgi:hypothetical protein
MQALLLLVFALLLLLLLLLLLSSPCGGSAASHVCLTAAALHYCFPFQSAVAMRSLQSRETCTTVICMPA